MPHLTLIIPCYNESRRIPGTLPHLATYLETLAARAITSEVLLIIERSADNTLAIARKIAATHPGWQAIDNQVHRGKGYAVRTGIARASAQSDFICYMDADLSTDPAAIGKALALLEEQPTTAIIAGDRRDPQSTVTRHKGKSRAIFSGVFNCTTRLLFPNIKILDTQCGFKMFRAPAARGIFARARIDGFAFDVEILLLAHRLGCPVRTMPVCWTDASHSTIRVLRHGAQMYRDLFRLRL